MLRDKILKKGLVVGIFLLFLVTSVGPIVGKNIYVNESVHGLLINHTSITRDNISCNHLAYIGGSGFFCLLYKFILNDTVNLTCNCDNRDNKRNILAGATWTTDWVIISFEYGTGNLWKIDPETCKKTYIGGGGASLNGITFNLVKEELYGCTSDDLYKIDIETGDQEYIGRFSPGVFNMISLACDADGVLYGWDLGNNLWQINKHNAVATLVGPLGIELHNAQDGHFCMKDDILYIAAHSIDPEGYYLYECDEDSGNCTLVGQFQDDVDVAFFVIPWNMPPNADFNWTPEHPDPGELIFFNASNSYDYNGDIISYEWDWDNDGEFDELYNISTATHIFEEAGLFPVTLRVQDNYSANDSKTMIVRVGNQPPDIPFIDGPISGKKGVNYTYCVIPVDPEGDIVDVRWDWGDGDITDWIGPYYSGEGVCAGHIWKKTENYTVKVKIKDEFGAESEWGELEINIPRNKISLNLIFLGLFDRFQFLQKILSFIGWYN